MFLNNKQASTICCSTLGTFRYVFLIQIYINFLGYKHNHAGCFVCQHFKVLNCSISDAVLIVFHVVAQRPPL